MIIFIKVEREGILEKQMQQNKGWFGGWFSWGGQDPQNKDQSEGDLGKKSI